MKYIHTLTGLRGIAAFIVFFSHAASRELFPRAFGHGFGQVGVMMFFMLSGFLMAYLYIDTECDQSAVADFLLARVGRVFPLYYLLLIGSIVASFWLTADSWYPYKFFDGAITAKSLLMFEAPYVFWTIPVEVQFYLLFVGLWYLHKRRGWSWWALILAGGIAMVPSVAVFLLTSVFLRIVCSYVFAFFIGLLTALLFDRIKQTPWLVKLAGYAGLPAFILLWINLPELRAQHGLAVPGDLFFRTWADPITWAIIYALFVSACLNSRSVAFLNWKPFAYLGEISYGFYLYHFPVLMFFIERTHLHPALTFLFALAVTIGISHLSLVAFETPLRQRIRKLRTGTGALGA